MHANARLLPAAVLALSLSSGCAAMAAQYNASLDNAVTVSAVDQRPYTRVAVDAFVCSDAGYACQPQLGQQAADQLALTMGRLGYEVFDSAQFHAWVMAPPAVVVSAPTHVGATVSVGPGGVAITANEGYEEVVVSAGGSSEVLYYESLPMESRMDIMERSGIGGVATGRITLSPPDETTAWQELHVLIRLGDARTGQVIWQGEWRETVMDGEAPEQALQESMEHLERALQRKAPLG